MGPGTEIYHLRASHPNADTAVLSFVLGWDTNAAIVFLDQRSKDLLVVCISSFGHVCTFGAHQETVLSIRLIAHLHRFPLPDAIGKESATAREYKMVSISIVSISMAHKR